LAVALAVSLITAPSSNGEQPAKKRAAPAAQAQAQTLAYAQARDEAVEAAVPVVVFAPLYGSSPRIIHVPQPDQDVQANAGDETVGTIDGGDANPPSPVRRIRPAPRN
jgi:hypothetical protein